MGKGPFWGQCGSPIAQQEDCRLGRWTSDTFPVTDMYPTKESIRLPEYIRTVILLQTLEFEGLVLVTETKE